MKVQSIYEIFHSYMALRLSSKSSKNVQARDLARSAMVLPLADTRDLHTKFKIVENEIMQADGLTHDTRYWILELLAHLNRSSISIISCSPSSTNKTLH